MNGPLRSSLLTLAACLLVGNGAAWGQAAPAPQPPEQPRPREPYEIAPAPKVDPLPDAEEFGQLFELTPLDKIQLSAQPLGHPAPPDRSAEVLVGDPIGDLRELRMEQGWAPGLVQWKATNFWHHPLYFEDVLLERHGQYCPWLQPGWSAAHFFATVPTLPYKAALERPCEKVYTLGFGRPGSCKRPLNRCLPWQADGSLLEAAAVVGIIALVP